jgi:hypothetical protein
MLENVPESATVHETGNTLTYRHKINYNTTTKLIML